ncbi:MAG: hypothetical protein HDR86_08630 [Bacteroides sp.]|nr:hypothetical protein [Bacteroides sp.]
MKSKIFLLLAAELLLPMAADACGAYFPMIPTARYFELDSEVPQVDYDRMENLRLWQSQTSKEIPLGDIEQVVYRDSQETFDRMTASGAKKPTQNLMYTYLKNSRNEAINFLRLAKGIEEARRDDVRRSPWYFPSCRYEEECNSSLENYIQQAMDYEGENLRERYAMQACRALFASNQYARCIEYYDSIFGGTNDSDLMKRMAGNYAAGSWAYLGDNSKADVLYARSGSVENLSVDNPVEYMLDHNPDAPQIMDYMRRYVANDSARMAKAIPLAKKALAKKSVTNKGDWAFFLAYYYNNYASDPLTAKSYLNRALAGNFSSEDLKNQATAYKMIINPDESSRSLLSNLRWFAERCNPLNPDADSWNFRLRNLIYTEWIPRLWERGDYATAILLADYADSKNLSDVYREESVRKNDIDRGSLTFQMMESLRSDQLAAVQKQIMAPTPLNNILRQNDLKNPNVFNELIGTLALREGNYARAIKYLEKVDSDYERSMRIYRNGYLRYDPFAYFSDQDSPGWTGSPRVLGTTKALTPKRSHDNVKLNFARHMLDYQKQSASAPTADKRAWARFMYALGRRNSFERCWALTQYVRGVFHHLYYWDHDFPVENYGFLYEYTPEMANETEQEFSREINAAMEMMKSDEMRAQAEYMLFNLLTIAKKYSNTKIASRLKASCDIWSNWL